MLVSIINKAQFSKYDCGFFILSPDFYQADKIAAWDMLHDKSLHPCSHYFHHIKDMVTSIEENAICYDLTDGLPKFFDGGTEVDSIISAKKIGAAGDFAIARMRSYLEEMGMVEDKNQLQLFSSEFLMFRAKTTEISTRTLFALCMTEHVQTILKRGQYGTGHPRFYDFLLTNLPIPDFLISMNRDVSNAIAHAVNIRNKAKDIYAETQNLLLAELGLSDWRPKHRLTYVKNYSAVKQAKRFDADYFQPKYDEIVNAVMNYKGGWGIAGDLLSIKSENFTPIESELYQYIELANIGNAGEVASCMLAEGENLPTRARRQVASGDVIVSSIEGSLSSIALINNQYDRALCSTGFHVVNSALLNSETLLVLLKSVIGQLQLKKGCNGTILTGISKDEFGKMVLPKIQNRVQAKIQEKISESFRLREQSEHLLECAKRAVEIAIEQDEKIALNWLKTATSNTAN